MAIRIGFQVVPDAQRLRIMVDALVRLNLYEMRKAKFKPLYESGVRYRRERRRVGQPERWQTIRETYRLKEGDCEDLAAIRVAELRRQGIRAVPWFRRHRNLWHVLVRYPNGDFEDPSRILGMGSED
jgi:transglutaminase-like putative cysteine protease